ncbi:hypothetical protein F4677DRAFT_415684 [Hypoxylon crocopeplum]|nr:hypothetical protein F4677DRAFT_415684 [Hypoxylon crocopeplum]
MSLVSLRSLYTQWFPPAPTFTEQQVPSQSGRVFIVTGGNAGIGFELCKILYGTGATIYMAARSKARAEEAIKNITASTSPAPENPGTLKFLHLDLNDLTSVRAAATAFASQESKLDVLWNNAGPGANTVPAGSRTAQGLEPMIGTHCVATLLFTTLLLPQLRAASAPEAGLSAGHTRVVWTSSFLAEGSSPTNGIELPLLKDGTADRVRNYAVAKAGTWMLGREFGARYGDREGIVSVVQNPGNVVAGSYGGSPALVMLVTKPLLHETRYGAYTELFAGLAPEVAEGENGCYVIPWGRIRTDEECPRKDIIKAMAAEEDGGLGYGGKLWAWCEQQWLRSSGP